MNYLKVYVEFMNSRRQFMSFSTDLDFYYENHHITPKCLGGLDKKSNLVMLTPREHYIAHKLLTKIFSQNKKVQYAFSMMGMNQTSRKLTSRQFEQTVKAKSEAHKGKIISDKSKEKMSAWQIGRTLPEETKRKISETLKAMPQERKDRMSISHKGSVLSEEHKQAMKDGQLKYWQTDKAEEQREKIRKSNSTRVVSEETKRKISESLKKRNAS